MANSSYIPRLISSAIVEVEPYYPVVVLTGPRQSGKTTLLRNLYADYTFVNLEQPATRSLALHDMESFLDSLGQHAIIDEVQNVPELLSAIQARVDLNPDLRYKLTGSSDFSLMHTVTQSLAGRAALFTLLPFSLQELPADYVQSPTDKLEFNGYYPGVICKGIKPNIFFSNYYTTYIQRDVRDLLQVKDIDKFHRYIRLLAGRTATEFNASALAIESGVTSPTASSWLSILKTSYIVFELPPYFANLNKRLTKSAKIYFYDTGLLCHLIGINSPDQLETHPLRGAIFENMVVSEFMKHSFNTAQRPQYSFYREKSGREIDLINESTTPMSMYEIKAAKTFRNDFTQNMNKIAEILPVETTRSVIYDGASIPPEILNFRNL